MISSSCIHSRDWFVRRCAFAEAPSARSSVYNESAGILDRRGCGLLCNPTPGPRHAVDTNDRVDVNVLPFIYTRFTIATGAKTAAAQLWTKPAICFGRTV